MTTIVLFAKYSKFPLVLAKKLSYTISQSYFTNGCQCCYETKLCL